MLSLQSLSNQEISELLENKNYELEIERAKTRIYYSTMRPFEDYLEVERTDRFDELIDDINWIEDEILTRECANIQISQDLKNLHNAKDDLFRSLDNWRKSFDNR